MAPAVVAAEFITVATSIATAGSGMSEVGGWTGAGPGVEVGVVSVAQYPSEGLQGNAARGHVVAPQAVFGGEDSGAACPLSGGTTSISLPNLTGIIGMVPVVEIYGT